jgi:hypothetical protein
MRHTFLSIIVSALVFASLAPVAGSSIPQTAPAFSAAGTDAAQVTAFLKTLQSAVSVGNRLKVASLVSYPLKAWVDGEETVIRNESEFQARYGRIFDADLKKAIAEAKVDTLSANQEGVRVDNGRICFRPVSEQKNSIRIVAINETGQPR